jgi:hypothetical protein
MTDLSGAPFTAFVWGLVLSAVLQSGTAVMILLIAFTQQGLLAPAAVLPLVLGANVGATSTAFVAASGLAAEGRRVAWGHLAMKVAAALLFLPLAPLALSAMSGTSRDGGHLAQRPHRLQPGARVPLPPAAAVVPRAGRFSPRDCTAGGRSSRLEHSGRRRGARAGGARDRADGRHHPEIRRRGRDRPGGGGPIDRIAKATTTWMSYVEIKVFLSSGRLRSTVADTEGGGVHRRRHRPEHRGFHRQDGD